MAVSYGLGVTGDGAGVVTPLDHKLAQSGLIAKTGEGDNLIRAGVFYDGVSTLVTGTAGMSYDVAPFTAALTRGASSGTVLLSNDGVVNVTTSAAPGSNSRIDIVYVWQREFSLDGTDSIPVIGVAEGTAAASPVAPSLASFPGALELARITVPAGVTATNSGTTISQTAPFTTVDGGVLVRRTTTERDAITAPILDLRCRVLADEVTYRYDGAEWQAWSSEWITYTPTVTNFTVGTGGSAASEFSYRYVDGLVRVKFRMVLGTSGASVGFPPTFSLPVEAITVRHTLMLYQGNGSALDSSATSVAGLWIVSSDASTTNVRLYTVAATLVAGFITSTAPWTWAAGDTVQGEFTFEPA